MQTANRKPQTANRKPQTANRKPQDYCLTINRLSISSALIGALLMPLSAQAVFKVKNPHSLTTFIDNSIAPDAEGFYTLTVPKDSAGNYLLDLNFGAGTKQAPETLWVSGDGDNLVNVISGEARIGNRDQGYGILKIDGPKTVVTVNGSMGVGGSESNGEVYVSNGAVLNQRGCTGYTDGCQLTTINAAQSEYYDLSLIQVEGQGSTINFENKFAGSGPIIKVKDQATLNFLYPGRHQEYVEVSELENTGGTVNLKGYFVADSIKNKGSINFVNLRDGEAARLLSYNIENAGSINIANGGDLGALDITNIGNIHLAKGDLHGKNIKNTGRIDIDHGNLYPESLQLGDEQTPGILNNVDGGIRLYTLTIKNILPNSSEMNINWCYKCTINYDSTEKLDMFVKYEFNNKSMNINKGVLNLKLSRETNFQTDSLTIEPNATLIMNTVDFPYEEAWNIERFTHRGTLDLADGTNTPKFFNFKVKNYSSGGKLVIDTAKNENGEINSDTLHISGAITGDQPTEIITKNGIFADLENAPDSKYLIITVDSDHQADAFTGESETANGDVAYVVREGNRYYWQPQPYIAAYTQMPHSNIELMHTALGTWHTRRGLSIAQPSWGRIVGKTLKEQGEHRFNTEQKQYLVQVGHDFMRQDNAQFSSQLGGFITLAENRLDFLDRQRAKKRLRYEHGSTRAFALGGYYSKQYASGFYSDFVANFAYISNKYQPRDKINSSNHGMDLALSAEVGKAYHLGNGGWTIEPQAQLVYQALKLQDFNEGKKHISQGVHQSLRARMGSNLTYQWSKNQSISLVTNLWRELRANGDVEIGNKTYTEDFSQNWLEVGLMAQAALGKNWNLYANLSVERALNSQKRNLYQGSLGVQYRW